MKLRTALVLGLCLVFVGGEPCAAQTAAPESETERPTNQGLPEVTVWALTYGQRGDGKSVGFCSPIHITAGNPRGNRVRIGFFESEVAGTGAQWRSAGWSAALVAAQLTDFDPRTLQVSFEFEGRVDGPSAGALMTIGVLAAARGDKVRDDAAMTGTINPDGTIGPVGGIPYKLEGAARQQKKLVLIPGGLRFERNDDGDSVDLIEHGRKLGMEVRPVVDIYSAYKLFTGVDLPRPPQASVPELSTKMESAIVGKTSFWTKMFRTARDDCWARPEYARNDTVDELIEDGRAKIDRVSRLLNEGELSAAYWDMVLASVQGYAAMELAKNRQVLQEDGRRALVNRAREHGWLRDAVAETAARLREETPQNIEQLLMYCAACDAFFEAISFQALATVALDNLPQTLGESTDDIVATATERKIMAWLDLYVCRDLLDFMAKCEGPPLPDDAPIVEVGRFYRRAGEANIAVFDSLVIDPSAKRYNLAVEQFRGRLMDNDQQYALLRGAELAVLPYLTQYFGEGEALNYAYLASGLYTYPASAGLIAKYYSIRPELDEDGAIVSVPRERTLSDWLDQIEDQARRSIGFLRGHDIAANICAMEYQIGRLDRSRDLASRFDALNSLMIVHVRAEAARRIAGLKLTDE
ncbi:MAG: hypothetical protein JNM18_21490 [Planctomycetaceae bacterium]|nr:hypothetical protein [Planctomycetaceae bacterium]